MQRDYILGLDLGQTTDYSALAVLERPVDAPLKEVVYALRHLQRFPLGTPYTAIVPGVARIAGKPPLRGAPLVVDQTGVGRPVVDMLRRTPGLTRVVPVTITGGHALTQQEDGSYHVPKKELVTCLQLLVEQHRLRIAASLSEAKTLIRELQTFRVKITPAAHETFGAWRESDHDDLVLAVALATWWAQCCPPWRPDSIGTGQSIIDRLPPGVFHS